MLSSNPPFVEITREDIVGKYIGHSEDNILRKINEAKGGVLFIDEAYSLYVSDSSRDFGNVIINVLVKQLDLHKNDLCVIMAGYTDEMLEFLDSNPQIV